MKRKVYLVYEQAFSNNQFVYDRDRQFFTSKNAAALWLEREKIRLMNDGYSIVDESIENCKFGAKSGNTTLWFNLWSGIPQ